MRTRCLVLIVTLAGCVDTNLDALLPPVDLATPSADLATPSADLAVAPSCSDSVRNGSETDVDCGGSCMTRCGVGKMCTMGADCVTSVCRMGGCVEASCSDGVTNGAETDVDCGGNCPRCGDGKMCKAGGDCSSSVCNG